MAETNQVKWVGVRPISPAENIPVTLEANNAGTLNVAVTGKTGFETDIRYPTGLTGVKTATGTGADTFNTAQAFGATVYEVMVIAETNGAILSLSPDNSNWSDDIHIPANVIMGITLKATHWKIKNRVAGSNVTYTISGIKP